MAEHSARTTTPAAPLLIGHRGYPLRYPENTLAGLRAALAAGAPAVELDVHLSSDHVPIVVHDANLTRTAGIDVDARDLPAARLASVAVGEPARFGNRFAEHTLPMLRDVVALAREYPGAAFFLDVKRRSLDRFGTDAVLEAILGVTGSSGPWILVSFDRHFVARARERTPYPVGWVVEQWDQATLADLQAFAPDFAFCAARQVPPGVALPAGPWQWVIYGIDEPGPAREFAARGATYIETDTVVDLLAALALPGR